VPTAAAVPSLDSGRYRGGDGQREEEVAVTEVVIPIVIRDLTPEDLPSCAWSGPPIHLASIAKALERARRGEMDYLAACPPSGLPVAVGGIDYTEHPGAGTLMQLAVHGALQSCGIGTILIHAAARRILARGLHRAELGVEESNPRARALYERLGYVAYGRAPDSWDEQAPDGTIVRYETVCTLMRKELS
jgi:ribosomal protein S18 acetylase RimI-like enzyme